MVTQDGPQYLIHLLFLFALESQVNHYTVTIWMSLVTSSFAICISIFNCIMCDHNEFDPILLEIELKRRQDNNQADNDKIKNERDKLRIML